MTTIDLLDILGDVRGEFLLEAQQLRAGEKGKKGSPRRRILLIAAVILLGLLLVGCAVGYMLRLGDLTLGTVAQESVPTYYDEAGNPIPTEASAAPRSSVSLQGPNRQAYAEWLAFLEQYKPSETAAAQLEATQGGSAQALPENCRDIYYCATTEMAAKLQEIAAKYDLKLLEKEYVCTYDYEANVLLQALHLTGLVKEDRSEGCRYLHGYFFDNGSFSIPMELTVEEWPEPILAEMNYVRKDCLYPYTATVAMTEDLREWNYTTRDGRALLLVLDGENAHIFADRPDAFFHVYMGAVSRDENGRREMAPEELEKIAECFDYTVLPQEPVSAEVTKFFAQARQDYQALRESGQQALYAGGYGDYAAKRLEEALSPFDRDNMIYSLLDLNGDGIEELIDYRSQRILTMKDGVCTVYFDALDDAPGTVGSLLFCRDGTVLLKSSFDGSCWYFRPEADGMKFVQAVDEKLGVWTLYGAPRRLEGERILEPEDKQPITQEQAYAIIDSYQVKEVGIQSMKRFGEPLKTYPYQDPNAVFIAKMLDKYENSDSFVYTLQDLRRDGKKALIVKMPTVMEWNGRPREGKPTIYGFRNGVRETVFQFDHLCVDGVLCTQSDDCYEFFRMTQSSQGDAFVSIEKLFVNEDGYWVRRTPGQDLSGNNQRLDYQVITREQAQQIIASYPKAEINWKPFSQYPLQ